MVVIVLVVLLLLVVVLVVVVVVIWCKIEIQIVYVTGVLLYTVF